MLAQQQQAALEQQMAATMAAAGPPGYGMGPHGQGATLAPAPPTGHPVPPAIPVPLAAADEGRVPQTGALTDPYHHQENAAHAPFQASPGHTAAAPVLAPPGLPVPATSPEAKRPVAPKRQSVKTLTKPEAPSLGGTSLGDKLSERRQAILGETPSGDHQEERPPEPRMPARISIHEDDDSDDALAEEE